jgi:hypothetical protein
MKILKHGLAVILGAVPLNYATSCALLGDSADGYVTNASTNTYQVTGAVQFVFSSPIDMARPSISFPANSLISAGQTAHVAHIRLPAQPGQGETCSFEIDGAVKKP